VTDADVIYFIEDGRVVEHGSHPELLAQNGAYAQVYLMQFADDTTDDAPNKSKGAEVARARA
jgi:subfamily B ATP-binding cassette protein MsbA